MGPYLARRSTDNIPAGAISIFFLSTGIPLVFVNNRLSFWPQCGHDSFSTVGWDLFELADSMNSLLLKATLTSFYPCWHFGQTPNNACAQEALFRIGLGRCPVYKNGNSSSTLAVIGRLHQPSPFNLDALFAVSFHLLQPFIPVGDKIIWQR